MEEKKVLVTIFPYFIDESDEVWLLLCKTFKLNILNGFGGKVDEDEDPRHGALRELSEEVLSLSPNIDRLSLIGLIKDGRKEIYTYTYRSGEKTSPVINLSEISEAGWYKLSNRTEYVNEMLSGDNLVLDELEKSISDPGFSPFSIDKTGDELLNHQTKNIFS